jgi:riboflavin synthase
LVKGIGRIAARADSAADRRFVVDFGDVRLGPLAVGGSIAVNGVCLTALDVTARTFAADVSTATLAVTTLGALDKGDRVNLEPPLRAGDPLDGHIVTGHVDGVGKVVAVEPAGRSTRLVIAVPDALTRYIAAKGSVAVDGVSLTVNAVNGAEFEVNIIPHTQAVTVIGGYAPGTAVNIEVDMLARYLERLVRAEPDTGIDRAFLRKHGYARDHR